ncbi:MAG: Hsp20/alpha crystallin family protein [Porticoccus sp.]|nr:Hsp20/alpha crystallin family protein [Porticoccus sp.]
MTLIPRGNFFDVDRFVDDFLSPSSTQMSAKGSFFAPHVDIVERDGHYEITAEMPGMKKEDIKITLENGVLRLEAESHMEDKEEKEGKIIRQERRYGKYVRSFDLGENIHEEDIKASFEDGVLKLTAPKVAEKIPQQRQIDIQ